MTKKQKKDKEAKKNIFFKILRISGIVLTSIIGVAFLVWGSLNLIKFAVYQDYYNFVSNRVTIPDLGDGFNPKGSCYIDSTNNMATVGYLNKEETNYMFISSFDNSNLYSFKITQNHSDFASEISGITYNNGYFYMSSYSSENDENKGVYRFELDYSLEYVEIGNVYFESDTNCSFIFSDDNYLYVGEYDDSEILINHTYSYQETTHTSIVQRYAFADLNNSNFNCNLVYSIPSNTYSFGFLNNYFILLYRDGTNNCIYRFYDLNEQITLEKQYNSTIDVLILNDIEKEFVAPPLMNSIDAKIENDTYSMLTFSESATSKHFLGSLFYLDKLFELNLTEYVIS